VSRRSRPTGRSAAVATAALLLAVAGCCGAPPLHETQDWRQQSEAYSAEQWRRIEALEARLRQLLPGRDPGRERRGEDAPE